MNKLMGFYELKSTGIPTISWNELTDDSRLDDNILWTVRTALLKGNDYNLPRFIGITSKEAIIEGKRIRKALGDNGVVIYYPYFIADKSGVLKIGMYETIIEAVKGDLWNLVTYGKIDTSIVVREKTKQITGLDDFIDDKELDEILKYCRLLRGKYREYIVSGKDLYLEWSFAYNSSIDKKPKGEKYIIFYEMRIG